VLDPLGKMQRIGGQIFTRSPNVLERKHLNPKRDGVIAHIEPYRTCMKSNPQAKNKVKTIKLTYLETKPQLEKYAQSQQLAMREGRDQ